MVCYYTTKIDATRQYYVLEAKWWAWVQDGEMAQGKELAEWDRKKESTCMWEYEYLTVRLSIVIEMSWKLYQKTAKWHHSGQYTCTYLLTLARDFDEQKVSVNMKFVSFVQFLVSCNFYNVHLELVLPISFVA